MIMVLTPPAVDASDTSTRDVIDKMFAGFKRQRDSWNETGWEEGEINQIPFVRKRWDGVDRRHQKMMYGFGYAAKIENQFVFIHSQDVEPHHEIALPLAEAAAMTFRKQ
jgi:hypothetical protein